MTSSQIRQGFLDFFRSKEHTIVPSASLMPDSPNLLFTNAGMNQFVPIFLGQQPCPFKPPRAADTQKCIRAGGKHNDLEDVGLDTYHHTFFEMLGNWSFGDYFKREAIEWAWELVTGIWKFPPHRLYATVYSPDKAQGDPSDFDQEAHDHWAQLFTAAGLDPKVHIRTGGKKDNFWMMGETGPCGPCSELHFDLTEKGDTRGELVNQGSPQCIEIWNLVFIQFNANPDKTFAPLPARHVDTGMGFERVASIIQGTKNFTNFSRAVSNYETDVFRPLFDRLERLSGKRYGFTLPKPGSTGDTEQEKIDVAFRVIADHIRTLSFAIADGIMPGRNDRHYVLRRILRRAVKYGRTLGLHEPFFYKLVDVLAETMGDVFPEVRAKRDTVQDVIKNEEQTFNETLDRGLELYQEATAKLKPKSQLSGEVAFKLYDTYGFPVDLTELLAREAGFTVDSERFKELMEEQKKKARAAQVREVITVSDIEVSTPTRFVGFEQLETPATVVETIQVKDQVAVALEVSPCYAEMGGQVGDTGYIQSGEDVWKITNTLKTGTATLHYLDKQSTEAAGLPAKGSQVRIRVDAPRRAAIQRHHTVTHLFHWALHEVVNRDAGQKGSYVGPEKLTFDFNSSPLTPGQIRDVEALVNERILENAPVSWAEVPYAEVKPRKDIMQFFGDKYGERVRVVQVGGKPGALDGYSMELCGGTHTRATGEVGLFRIVAETGIAAGVRRIEAISGTRAYEKAREEMAMIQSLAARLNSPIGELEKKLESTLTHQKELEKQLKTLQQRGATETARSLISKATRLKDVPALIQNLGEASGDELQMIADAIKGQWKGVILLGGVANGAVSLVAAVTPEYTAKVQAGKIIQAIAPLVGGKGGGRPDNARGGGKEAGKLDAALAQAAEMIGRVA